MEKQNEQTPKMGHGGARVGAGRKKVENSRNIRASFMLSSKANETLTRLSAESGRSKNDIINKLLEGL